ncbi:MAG: PEGA domain-containing protein [Candidatus Magasanikbacteria bacterium]|nr:PEGA domain-containing protein [Candidatus Magasanikbacteria bacterium]
MEYPGAHFTRPWRRLLLSLTMLGFFIIAPAVIISTIGYKYNWIEKKLKATGALSIDVAPSQARVYLNGTKLPGNLPLRLNHVPPGNYTVRLTNAEFYDWQKDLTIRSNETVYLKDIILIKKNESIALRSGTFTALTLSPDGRYLVFTSSSAKNREVWLLNTEIATANAVMSLVATSTALTFSWSPKNDYAAIITGNSPSLKITLVPAATPERTIPLGALVAGSVKKIEWANSTDPALYVNIDKKLLLVSPLTKEVQVIKKNNNFIDWFFENNRLWALQMASSTREITIVKDALGFSSIIHTFATEETTMATSTSWQLNEANGETALLQNTKKQEQILINNQGSFKLPSGTSRISPFQNWWFIWSPWELWGYTGKGEPFLLNRSGEKLNNVVPIDEFNTVALIWENRVTAFFPNYGTQQTIINRPINSLAANPKQRIIYFADDQGLWKLPY